jgi:hypothetical protein
MVHAAHKSPLLPTTLAHFGVLVIFVSCMTSWRQSVAHAESPRDDIAFINDILKNHCVKCHGKKVKKADVRLDQIDWKDLSLDAENLQEALEQVILDDMPPPKKSTLSKEDRLRFHSLVTEKLRRFHAKNREPAAFIPAKLNKAQFINSLEDLLGVPIREDLVSSLPGDKSGDARIERHLFKTNRNTLSFSLLHYELYKSCIEDALELAIPDEAPSMEPFWSHRFNFSIIKDTPTKGRSKGKEISRLITKGNVVNDVEPPVGFTYNRDQRFDRLPTKKQFGVDDVVDTRFFRVSKTRVCPPTVLRDNGIVLPPQYSPLEFGRIDVHFLGPNVTLVFPEIKQSVGMYRLRVHASKGDTNKEHPKLAVYAGPISYFLSPKVRRAGSPVLVDAPAGKPKVYEFFARLDESAQQVTNRGTTPWRFGFLLRNEYFVPDGEKTDSPSIHIQRIELDGPYYKSWPIPRERNIFLKKAKQQSEPAYAKRIINNFLARAFRGDVDRAAKDKYFAYWQAAKNDGSSFRQGIKQTLTAILLSPNFLYIDANAARSRNQETAARLAYFLWNSPPSAGLLQRAKSDKWKASDELDYMLNNSRIDRFMHAFAGEWLQLKDKPDEMLRGRVINSAMSQEPGLFLKYLFQKNRSLENLIDSDFVIINDALAKWYDIKKRQGPGFSFVKLPAASTRGGVLTMAAPLTSHAREFGVSGPILRGVWLCERILGRRLPPPPMNVEFPNPDDFEGFEKLTVKEQLKFHMENSACYGCHRRIDPLGIPFENFDGYGRWREKNYVYKMINAKTPRKIELAKSDATSTIKGQEVDGIIGLKSLLMAKHKDEALGAFTEFLYEYAIGRNVRVEEQAEMDDMLLKLRASDYKPKVLLRLIVNSKSFSNPRNGS